MPLWYAVFIMTQDETFAILKTGANVFLTGEPGSGKTHTVNRYVAWLRERGIEPAVTASTGIAATHIGGRTLHSFSGIGIKRNLTKEDLRELRGNSRRSARVKSVSVLIIDEVSMLSASTFSMADLACRAMRGNESPFGGLQVVLVGDFFQLPPVVPRAEPEDFDDAALFQFDNEESLFAFDSRAWRELDPTVCYLSEQHRQSDAAFLGILSAIRREAISGEHRALLESRKTATPPPGVPRFFPHNAQVDRANDIELLKLPGKEHAFAMTSSGAKNLAEHLKRGCLSPEALTLKIGARVMFTKNDSERKFVNGTLGVVEGFSPEQGFPIVITNDGRRITAEREEWSVEDSGETLARITQVPLRLAWAITVHKSQGMSLDAAHMDLSTAFEHGQGYVAISRVRTLAGLSLGGLNARALEVHPEIRTKDREFRESSLAAEVAFAAMPADELVSQQNDFIRRSGGQIESSGSPSEGFALPAVPIKHDGYSEIREEHPNAYRPWTDEDDDELAKRFVAGEKTTALAEAFGRKYGAIRSRLKKLGLVE